MGINFTMLRALTHCRTAPMQVQRWAMPAFQVRGFADASFLSNTVVEERVLETMKTFEKVDVSKLSSDSHFKNDLGLDSLDAVEEEFMVEIPDGDAEKIQSCKEAIDYIVAHPQ